MASSILVVERRDRLLFAEYERVERLGKELVALVLHELIYVPLHRFLERATQRLHQHASWPESAPVIRLQYREIQSFHVDRQEVDYTIGGHMLAQDGVQPLHRYGGGPDQLVSSGCNPGLGQRLIECIERRFVEGVVHQLSRAIRYPTLEIRISFPIRLKCVNSFRVGFDVYAFPTFPVEEIRIRESAGMMSAHVHIESPLFTGEYALQDHILAFLGI